ncbi:MAG: hypothetical protein IKJ93_02540 [Clostridia bacterium]|nr:hypothetical protein [Clostridia bacterium]
MKKLLSLLLCFIFLFCLAGCEKFDDNYGNSSTVSSTKEDDKKKPTKIPEIKSDDEVMPTYLDISLYDEENYSDIYLGSDFEYKITYVGSSIKVPSSYKEITKDGWVLVESGEYGEDSQILAGKKITADFVNDYGKKITAVFYNAKKKSVSLKKCPIVKFVLKENEVLNSKSQYGQFWVNGISNISSINDTIEALGSPSHFYCVSENKYYLEWFLNEKDRRSRITVYVDTAEDHIEAIEFSYY